MKTLRIVLSSFLALVVLVAAFANEFGNMPQVKEITNGQPEDVVAFIERRVECNHWAGEEPYDKERTDKKSSRKSEMRQSRFRGTSAQAEVQRKQEGSRCHRKGERIGHVSFPAQIECSI